MSWYSDFKQKRADKAATKAFNESHQSWQEDVDTLDKIITVLTAARNGEDSIPNTLMQKSNERTLWEGKAVFHETGRSPSHYVGASSGFSVPIAAGIRFRVGAQRGTLVPGEEYQMDRDEGRVLLTTERLIFVGPVRSTEWNFDKLLMLSTNEDESDYFIAVSNRQKTSGVRFSPKVGREFNRFLGSATAAHESGYDEVLDELEKLKKEAIAIEPKLELPAKI